MKKKSRALYIHFPFCLQKCTYCSFNSEVFDKDLSTRYLSALKTEISGIIHPASQVDIISLFFGGGTPSLLPTKTIKELLDVIDKTCKRKKSCEITVEANPGTISPDYCKALLKEGVNRLSIGVQSFDNRLLNVIGRVHNRDQAVSAVENARRAGFKNVSIDLMFGLPGQTLAEWKKELVAAASLRPDHISAYGLTPEPGTPLADQIKAKEIKLPDEDTQKRMYEATIHSLKNSGYTHYEISNFSLPGKECAHNINYWDNGEYAGFGAGAYSFLNNVRKENVSDITRYNDLILKGNSAAIFSESLSKDRFIRESVILNLRKTSGVNKKCFEKRFGIAIMDVLKDEINQLETHGLLVSDNDSIRLTQKGIILSDSVFMEIVL